MKGVLGIILAVVVVIIIIAVKVIFSKKNRDRIIKKTLRSHEAKVKDVVLNGNDDLVGAAIDLLAKGIKESKEDIHDMSVDMADATAEATEIHARAVKEGLTEEEKHVCKHCGAEVNADAKFCDSCGGEL